MILADRAGHRMAAEKVQNLRSGLSADQAEEAERLANVWRAERD